MRYISAAVTALKYHPELKMDLGEFTGDVDVHNALANIRKVNIQKEDNRIPVTPSLLTELCSIADRDFSPQTALSFKAAMWG